MMHGASTSSATVVVSNEVVPPGAVAQLKFSLSKPALIAAGELAIDLDPTRPIGFRFNSTRLGSVWTDPQGNTYAFGVSAGTVTVGGSLSITSVSPGGGLLASGALIDVDGTGFGNAATAQIDGASVASVQVAGPGKILVTLGGPTESAGKRIRITNPDGSAVDVFPFLPGVPISSSDALNGGVAILPLQTYIAASFPIGGSFSSGGMAIRNPNPVPVQLILDSTDTVGGFQGERSLTVPAGGLDFRSFEDARSARRSDSGDCVRPGATPSTDG